MWNSIVYAPANPHNHWNTLLVPNPNHLVSSYYHDKIPFYSFFEELEKFLMHTRKAFRGKLENFISRKCFSDVARRENSFFNNFSYPTNMRNSDENFTCISSNFNSENSSKRFILSSWNFASIFSNFTVFRELIARDENVSAAKVLRLWEILRLCRRRNQVKGKLRWEKGRMASTLSQSDISSDNGLSSSSQRTRSWRNEERKIVVEIDWTQSV